MAELSFLTYLRGIYKLNLNTSSRVHHAIIQSIYDCFIMARDDMDAARLEMCLSTATGHWLDYWGEFFSVYRKASEEDVHYSKRIVDYVIKPKSTIPAIKDNIIDFLNSEYNKNYTREDINIKEPWKEIAKYSHKGTLSHNAKFFSGDYYSHAIMDISVPESITPELIDLVNSIKAAGVKVIWSILNSYDIVSGFNDADDAWVTYSRHIQTQTKRNHFTGLVLSNTSPNPVMSGTRQVWFITTSMYQWYATVKDKSTDESILITKKDLIGLLDSYTELTEEIDRTISDNYVKMNSSDKYVVNNSQPSLVHYSYDYDSLTESDRGQMSRYCKLSGGEWKLNIVENITKLTDELLETLELLDDFMSLSYTGRMSTPEGIMMKHLAEHELFGKLMKEVDKFKEHNKRYYNSLQPPILTGERAMFLVERNKNWLWNTPTMTHQDFYELWEPFDDYHESLNELMFQDSEKIVVQENEEWDLIQVITGTKALEHTINTITEFEDAYYKGYITFGDKYQPPLVIGDKLYGTPRILRDWLYDSPVYRNMDLEEIYRRQFKYILGKIDVPNPELSDIMTLEEHYNYEGYSIATITQPSLQMDTYRVLKNKILGENGLEFLICKNSQEFYISTEELLGSS